MTRNLILALSLLLLTAAIILSACAAPQAENPDAVAAAVEATLTAVAADAAPSPSQATPPATPSDPPPAAAPNLVLPPLVNGFDPAPRPASSKGNPDAPVVIYEWSDYT